VTICLIQRNYFWIESCCL